jgi:hypothetical protein
LPRRASADPAVGTLDAVLAIVRQALAATAPSGGILTERVIGAGGSPGLLFVRSAVWIIIEVVTAVAWDNRRVPAEIRRIALVGCRAAAGGWASGDVLIDAVAGCVAAIQLASQVPDAIRPRGRVSVENAAAGILARPWTLATRSLPANRFHAGSTGAALRMTENGFFVDVAPLTRTVPVMTRRVDMLGRSTLSVTRAVLRWITDRVIAETGLATGDRGIVYVDVGGRTCGARAGAVRNFSAGVIPEGVSWKYTGVPRRPEYVRGASTGDAVACFRDVAGTGGRATLEIVGSKRVRRTSGGRTIADLRSIATANGRTALVTVGSKRVRRASAGRP